MSIAPGVTSNIQDWAFDLIDAGIDLRFEEAKYELALQYGVDTPEYEEALENLELGDDHYILVGDWKLTNDGKFQVNTEGHFGWAGTYRNTNGHILVVEYSRKTVFCQPTSPCYVQQDGKPCGDLDTTPGPVEAYTIVE